MTSITLDIPEERLTRLQARAKSLGVTLEELVRLSIDELLRRPTHEVHQAIEYFQQLGVLHAVGYARHPVQPGEFDVWSEEQTWEAE